MDVTGGNIFEGRLVRLRGVEPEDWETLFAWNQDTDSERRMYFIPFPTSKEEVRQWVAQRALQRGEDDTFFFLTLRRGYSPTGSRFIPVGIPTSPRRRCPRH